jgi:hypothetical protein
LAQQGELFVFELWQGDEMVAADFVHAAGPAAYVATRFFDAKMPRKLQLGYVMAFVVAKVLQKQVGSATLEIFPLQSHTHTHTSRLPRVVAHGLFSAAASIGNTSINHHPTQGYAWLDYGGTDASVLMSYKHRIANVLPAPLYVSDQWRRADEGPGVQALGPGTLVERVSHEDLVQL